MRRILVISMAAAIPAVLPMNASDARVKPKPHSASAHGKIARTGHSTRNKGSHTNHSNGRPENDVDVSTDDPGNVGAPSAAPGASGQPGAPGSTTGRETPGTDRNQHGAKAPRKRTRSATQSRPSTGPDTGFSIPDEADLQGDMGDMAMPREAAEVIKAIGTRTAPRAATPPQAATPARPAAPTQAIKPVQAAKPVQARPAMPAQPARSRRDNIKFTAARARLGGSGAGASQLTLRTSVGAAAGRSVTLNCEPAGGSHPKALQACEDVAKSGGDLKAMPAAANPRACFMIYAPVTVSAEGDWHGQPVRFTAKYPNTCVMRDKTGSVFDF